MSFERLRAMNPRGRRIPVVLGVALAAGLLAIAALASTAGRLGAAGWGTVTGSLLVAAAGGTVLEASAITSGHWPVGT